MKVSVVIPSNREEILVPHDSFHGAHEVILALDEGKGPAFARNKGAERATGDIILFTGDDCLPHPHLVACHQIRHAHPHVEAVQGYSPFHWSVMDTPFMAFLNDSGIQANWKGIKPGFDASGFCLTTNFSIKKSAFLQMKGFSEAFPNAAWEDVEFGWRLKREERVTYFEPNAVAYHVHRHDLKSFIRRQLIEGRSRVILCQLHPEMAEGMLDLEGLKWAKQTSLDEVAHLAESTHISARLPQGIELMHGLWGQALKLASLTGTLEGLEKAGLGAIVDHCTHSKSPVYVLSYFAHPENPGWQAHCREWLTETESEEAVRALLP